MNDASTTVFPVSITNRVPTRVKIEQFHSCVKKIAHRNWLSAYLHVKRLLKLNPYCEAAIYPCEHCGFLHVGRPISQKRIRRYLKRLEHQISHPKFKLLAPPEVQEKLLKRREKLRRQVQYE